MAWNEPGPGRDPWNQGPKRGDNKKPPQLDDILKRLKERFGGKGGGGGSSGGGLPKNLPAGLIGLGAIVIVGLWLASGAYVVDERSEEHTSELQSLMRISYAVFCLKKKIPTSKHKH